jgi:hypothetical protein
MTQRPLDTNPMEPQDHAGDPGTDLQLLAKEKEAVELRRSIAQTRLEELQSVLAQKRLLRPWWRSWNVTALAALIAAVTPVTTGVQAYIEKERQVELDAQKQRHQIALEQEKQANEINAGYLDRIAKPDERRRVLRYLIATSTRPAVQDWARRELEIVNQDVAERGQAYEEQKTYVEQLQKEILAKADGPEQREDLMKMFEAATQELTKRRYRALEVEAAQPVADVP